MANGGIIGTVNNPTSSTATGVWQQEEQYEAKVTGTWPQKATFTTKSCRFNSGSSDSLTRTPSSASNRKTWTWSCWVKRSILTSGDQSIFNSHTDAQNQLELYFNSDDSLYVTNRISNTGANLRTNRKFQDASAWCHIVLAVDTTQGTNTNRMKLYVNGVQETSFSEAGYPGQNTDTAVNNTVQHRVGDSNLETFFNGYIAESILIDGQALAPTSFGVANSDGVWTPIIYTGTFGTNGFNLQFENSAALGTDSSSNGNTFTVNNLTSIDQSTDYPEVNFATLNPLDVSLPSTFTLSNGNLENLTLSSTDVGGNNTYGRIFSTIQVASGKWYAEMKWVNTGAAGMVAVTSRSGVITSQYAYLGKENEDWRYYHDGTKMNNNSSSSYGNSQANGDIVGVALDLDNLKIYFSKNGTWQNSGNPESGATGTGAAFTLTAPNLTSNGAYKFGIGTQGGQNVKGTWNFGSPSFAISSGNADGNGYGNFEYAVPSGYYSLNTKNLGEFG